MIRFDLGFRNGTIEYEYDNSAYESDSYTFTSNSEQFVTITLIPDYALDDFDISVKDESGTVIATSNTTSLTFIDWVQIATVEADTKLTVEVTLNASGQYLTKDYRLIVVGSTEYINSTYISGDHQIKID